MRSWEQTKLGASTVRSEDAVRNAMQTVGLVLGFFVLLSLSAKIRIPVPGTDVPMTLQLLVVMMTGFMLSPSAAVATLVLYLACGSAGLPVFAGIGGLAGPTGGYLVGFLAAAWLISVLKGPQNARFFRLFATGLAGAAIVLILGAAWRFVAAKSLGLPQNGVSLAVIAGVLPFLFKAAIEVAIVVALVQSLRGMRLRWNERTNQSVG